MSEATSSPENEFERQYRVIDQMLTMHSSLRDRMERRAFWLNTSLLALSVFLTVFAFVGDEVFQALGLESSVTRFVLGVVSVAVLIISITEFRVDWKSVAARHADAAKRLGDLKAQYRQALAASREGDVGGSELERLTREYQRITNSLVPIPDRWFNALKSEHLFKQLLSKTISEYPKTPVWFLRLRLRLEGFQEAWHGKKGGSE